MSQAAATVSKIDLSESSSSGSSSSGRYVKKHKISKIFRILNLTSFWDFLKCDVIDVATLTSSKVPEGTKIIKPQFWRKLSIFSDTDSDFDDVPDTKHIQQKAPSMPSFMETGGSPIPPVQKETKPPAKSMPQFLNDDLQLSESDEDSNWILSAIQQKSCT